MKKGIFNSLLLHVS